MAFSNNSGGVRCAGKQLVNSYSAMRFAALLLVPTALPGGQQWAGQLDLAQVWTRSEGAGVVVAVLDTGVAAGHPDLAGAVVPGRAFPDLGDGTRDDRGHGTEIALLVAGRGAAGFRGLAPRASVLPVKVNGGSDTLADAVFWAVDNGADILNISQGNRAKRQSPRLDEALRHAAERGVAVVAAAGNVPEDDEVTSPADHDGVIAVSAVDGEGRFRADVSVRGPRIALAAPGVDIDFGAGTRTGTSYSAAVVSGALALVMARYPDLDGSEAAQRLIGSARDAGPPGWDEEYGFGVVDPVAATSGDLAAPAKPVWPLVAGAGLLAACAVWWRRRRS